jgi:hypothetical protein
MALPYKEVVGSMSYGFAINQSSMQSIEDWGCIKDWVAPIAKGLVLYGITWQSHKL